MPDKADYLRDMPGVEYGIFIDSVLLPWFGGNILTTCEKGFSPNLGETTMIPLKYSEACMVADQWAREAEAAELAGNFPAALFALEQAEHIEPRTEQKQDLMHWVTNLRVFCN